MKIVHVIPSMSAEASGPSYSVTRLCESLLGVGADVRLAALDEAAAAKDSGYRRYFAYGRGPRRLGVSPTMRRWLEMEAANGRLDFIHNHSLWMMPNVYPGGVCRRFSACRLIVSPRGTLSSWALRLNAAQKRVFWALLQGRAVRDAVCFHATAENEYEDIRRRGFSQPVCVLPNGIDVPPLSPISKPDRRQLLFLGRIHPTKGLDLLLQAWRVIETRFPEWDLHIAGPDNEGYLEQMRALAAQLRLTRVVFRGALYGDEKLRAYRSASLFVLPTHSENFGMAVAEALAAGTPAIVTAGAPWRGLVEQGAGWWIDIGVDPLIACLEESLAMSPSRLAEMGMSGRRWMTRDYSWQRIAEQMSATYRWLADGGSVPPWVNVN